jgi:2,3-dihydroxy-p-cumate/2,3-dihydroxybenzoate 3,4-dioxygenase
VSASTPLLVGLAYARLAAADVAASARFALDILGLQSSEAHPGEAAFRSDDRSRTLVFAPEGNPSLAVEAWDEAALETLERRLNSEGFSASFASAEVARARGVGAALFSRDATGNLIEIVVRPERSGRRFFGRRDAGVVGLASFGLRSTKPADDLRFWRALGADIADRVGDAAYLALDRAHHRIALYHSQVAGPLYVAFEVASFDDLMRAHYFLTERQIRIVQGPGRQPASEQAFVHFLGPDNLIYSYVHGIARRDEKPRPPRQFAWSAESLCAWGSRAEGALELSPDRSQT